MSTTTTTMRPTCLADLLPPAQSTPRMPYWDAQGKCHWLEAAPNQVLEDVTRALWR